MEDLKEMVLKLINDYGSCARYMCKALKDNYPSDETLLRSRRINLIPKEGTLLEGIKFSFHGVGCYFEFENGSIDIDFGPNSRCDGFDSYRLFEFLQQSKKKDYIPLHNQSIFNREFENLVFKREIIKGNQEMSPHLYYLKSAVI